MNLKVNIKYDGTKQEINVRRLKVLKPNLKLRRVRRGLMKGSHRKRKIPTKNKANNFHMNDNLDGN